MSTIARRQAPRTTTTAQPLAAPETTQEGAKARVLTRHRHQSRHPHQPCADAHANKVGLLDLTGPPSLAARKQTGMPASKARSLARSLIPLLLRLSAKTRRHRRPTTTIPGRFRREPPAGRWRRRRRRSVCAAVPRCRRATLRRRDSGCRRVKGACRRCGRRVPCGWGA